MKPKLTENEKRVLKYLINDGRMQCTDIGKNLGISSQAVGKIKDKLEKEGFIRGYTAQVDYEKLGIEVFAIAMFKFKSGEMSQAEEDDLRKRISGAHMIRAYRLAEEEFTHMVLYGFRSIKEVENYFQLLQKEREHISEVKKLFVFTSSSIIKDSSKDVLLKVIDELEQDVLARPDPLKPSKMGRDGYVAFFS